MTLPKRHASRLGRTFPRSLMIGILLCGLGRLSNADSGQVIDEETKRPLEGVYVMASWTSGGPSIAHSSTVCYHFEVTQTDRDGKYSLPDFSWNFNPLLWDRYVAHEFYLPGYEDARNNAPGRAIWRMRPYRGSTEERLNALATGYRELCVPESERRQELGSVYRAQADEAARIASSEREREIAMILKERRDRTELGRVPGRGVGND